MRVILTLLVGVLFTQFLRADPPTEKRKPDSELIQGTWEVISEKEAGKPRETDDAIEMTLSEGEIKATRDKKPAGSGKYKIDHSKNPKWIDITTNGVTFQGIYEFVNEDTLRICHSDGNSKVRPTKFVSEAEGSNRNLAVSIRVKKDATEE